MSNDAYDNDGPSASATGNEIAEGLAEQFSANRRNWDNRAAIHLGSSFYDVDAWLSEQHGPDPREAGLLGNVTGVALVHLQCHFGLDTLAWARAGADVVGLDFSGTAIANARDLAAKAGL